MARIWCSGFEINSTTADIEWTTVTGSVSLDTTIKHSGTYSLRCNASNEYVRKHIYNVTQTNIQYIQVYLYIATLPTSGTIEICGFGTSDARSDTVGLKSTGKLCILSAGSQQGSDSTSTLTTGVWYRIEFKAGYGVLTQREVKVDGSSEITQSYTGTTAWNYVECGLRGTANSADIYLDNFILDSSAYPGGGKLVMLLPNASGDDSAWTPLSGSNYANVDENPPDDATSYVSSSTDAQSDLYNMQSFSDVGVGTVTSVAAVYLNARLLVTAFSGSQGLFIKCKEGGSTTTSGTVQSCDSNNAWDSWDNSGGRNPVYRLIMTTKPSTGSWTESTVNAMQCGYNSEVVGGNTTRVTLIWAYVEGDFSEATAWTKDLSDTVTLAEVIVKSPSIPKSDSIAIAESRDVKPNKIFLETIGLTDTFNNITFGKNLSEILTIVDALAKVANMVLADSVTISDTPSKGFSTPRTDSISISETQVSLIGKIFTESFGISDSLVQVFGKILSSTVAISDLADPQLIGQLTKSLSDTVTISDALTKLLGLVKSDSMSLADALAFVAGISKSDTMAISDSVASSTGKVLTDTMAIAESIVTLRGLGYSLSDSVTIVESMVSLISKRINWKLYIT